MSTVTQLAQFFNLKNLVPVYAPVRDGEAGTTEDARAQHAIIAFFREHTSIFKRDVMVPAAAFYTVLTIVCMAYYYTLCKDKTWVHTIEMVAPVFVALLLSALGQLLIIDRSVKARVGDKND